jgi:lipopolysaccharide/colanic/teichoic acid biosynthesis glycosyltransferase
MNRAVSTFPVWKRLMDIVLSAIGLIISFPLFLVIAAIIKMTSPGPAFLKQERIGHYERPFFLWKFRSMRVDADAGPHEIHLTRLIATNTPMIKLDVKSDLRVFPFGRILRRTCLDELPQLINVLRGEMSLVGPRPCLVYEAQQYRGSQKGRFGAMPGITGLWQVSGKNKTTFTQMICLDIAYKNQVSLLLDLKILLKTIPVIVAEAIEAATREKQIAAEMDSAAMRKDA